MQKKFTNKLPKPDKRSSGKNKTSKNKKQKREVNLKLKTNK